ncbi:MAG: protein kinase [Candidatus Eisenbacteria bacterium]
MDLSAGTRLGRYEIVSLLGSGAMGVVYRARDNSLGRDVAIKVLPAAFSNEPERLRRFDQEARAAGALQHPNIVAIFDLGSHDGAPFVVTELLEGHTLRGRLEARGLPLRKALDYGVQVARGLAAAHAKGIIHRDLKPENLFVTDSGQVKILDFGLAKLVRHEPGSSSGTADSLAATAMTEMGRVLGTVGYMAPEQVRGAAADQRADLFALGCVLYEMLTGVAPFRRESPAESMAAILGEDLPKLPADVSRQAPLLDSILHRCTEKLPGERFESARDLAFALETLAESGAGGTGGAPGGSGATAGDVRYERVSFRRGAIWSARFTPDGHSVVYSASWEGKPLEVFWSHIGNPEARSLNFTNTDLLSLSPTNEMAVLLRAEFVTSFDRRGTLARVPPMGGAAREMLHDVHAAEWSRDGQQLAIVRMKSGMIRLEFPVGNVLLQTTGWISAMRFSPDGQSIAYIDHPSRNSDSGCVAIVDRKGARRVLSNDWGTLRGLAWAPGGDEVWFSADRGGAARGLYAVTLDGQLRRVLQLASNITVHDIAADGRVLIGHGPERAGINALGAGETRERDLSWLDWSLLHGISSDGRTLLLDETAEGGGTHGSVYLRDIDGSPAVRLGDGAGRSLSPDGAWVVAMRYGAGGLGAPIVLPTGVGEPRDVPTGNLHTHMAAWLPDSRHVIVSANEPGCGVRLYQLDSHTGESHALSPEGVDPTEFTVVPEIEGVIAMGADHDYWVYSLTGADPKPLPQLERFDRVVTWLTGENALLFFRTNEMPAHLYRLDLATGERTLHRDLTPPDPTGIYRIGRVRASADGKVYGYTYYMQLVDLHVISGLK